MRQMDTPVRCRLHTRNCNSKLKTANRKFMTIQYKVQWLCKIFEQFGAQQLYNTRIQIESKRISNDQELIQSDPIYCPQNQKGNN